MLLFCLPQVRSWCHPCAGEAGIDAVWLSKAVGRPVRVQGMRYEGRGWGPKGPASIHHARAALDQDGAVVGYVFGWGIDRWLHTSPVLSIVMGFLGAGGGLYELLRILTRAEKNADRGNSNDGTSDKVGPG